MIKINFGYILWKINLYLMKMKINFKDLNQMLNLIYKIQINIKKQKILKKIHY